MTSPTSLPILFGSMSTAATSFTHGLLSSRRAIAAPNGPIPNCATLTGSTEFMAAHCTSRKQHGLRLFLLHKVRDADAGESIAAVEREFEFLQQRGADTREVVAARGWELGRL